MAKKKAVKDVVSGVVAQDVVVTAGEGGLTDAVATPDVEKSDVPVGSVAVNTEVVDAGAKSPDHHVLGAGGELHQVAGGTHPQMTNQRGLVIDDDENSLKANDRGPDLAEDMMLVEKTQHFDHERIPERIVHARGFGAKGYFELTDSLKGITKAGVF